MCKSEQNIVINTQFKWDNSKDMYFEFLQSLRNTFKLNTSGEHVSLFKTDIENLFDIFLENLPEIARQHYNCAACRHFVNHYGNLVLITKDGKMKSAVWNEAPGIFDKAVKAMKKAVLKGKVADVFITEHAILGTPITDGWDHMYIQMPSHMIYHSKIKTSGELMAEKREDFKSLMNGITEFSEDTVNEAVNLLNSGALARSEKHAATVQWLRDLYRLRSATKNKKERDNIIWYAVATAPEGWCHVKSSMVGTLLEDIRDGLSLDTIKSKRRDKMDGLQYQRPQVSPTEGNINEAEKIFAALDLGSALQRRYARLDEIQKIWESKTEKPIEKEESGLFSHLKPKQDKLESAKYAPKVKITWRKFAEEVLPKAKSIEYYVPGYRRNYTAIVTAVDPDAKPIIQWDSEEKRNPFSWYLHNDGSLYTNWNIASTGYHKVNAICFQPSMWYEENAYQGKGVLFILDGAKDSSYEYIGAALFPEILKSYLRPVRATIESYSSTARMQGYEESSACGIFLSGSSEWNELFLVTTDDGMTIYTLDRWD